MNYVTKTNDKAIKYVSDLNRKKNRLSKNLFYDEGIKNILSSTDSNYNIDRLYIREDKLEDIKKDFDIKKIDDDKIYVVKEYIFSKLSDTVTSQGVIATFGMINNKLSDVDIGDKIVVVLDCLQDPGNLASIFRTSEAFGIKKIFYNKGTVDPYSPKVVRASMGSIYNIDLFFYENILQIKQKGYKIYTTDLKSNTNIGELKLEEKSAIVFGNEGNGISKEILDNSDISFKIPMRGKGDSLNVSVSTGIVLYEITKMEWLKC